MKKLLLSALLLCLATSAWADGTIDSLGAAGAIAGTESIPVFQTANPALKTTPNALDTYLSQTTKALTNKTINCANNTCTGLPISTGVSGLGTGVATFLGTPSAANFLTMTGVLGLGSMAALPSSNVFAGDAGGRPIAASITGDLGFGAASAGFVTATVTGIRGTSIAAIGTGVPTALGINVGSAGAFVKNNGDALSGTFSGSPTLSGTAITLSGAATGTQDRCLGLTSGGVLATSAGACGTGAGSGNVTAAGTLTSAKIMIGQGTTATAVDADAGLVAGALSLGASGTAGSVALGNTTSGTVTLQPIAGALGSVTASLPANTGTLAELNLAQTWTAKQTMSAAGPLELGANSGNVGSLKIYGNTSGDALITVPAAAGTSTRFQLPATNGTNNYILKTDGSGNTDWVAPGGGGSLTVTDGTNSVSGTTTLTVGSGFLVGGSAGSATLNTTGTINTPSSGASYTILDTDAGKTVLRTHGSAMTDTVPQATGATFGAGFGFGLQTGAAGDTLTPTTSTVNGLAALKLGPQQAADWLSDGTNWRVALGVPQPPTQTGTTFLRDDMTWVTEGSGTPANPTATVTTTAVNGSASTYMRSDAAPAIAQCSSSVFGACKVDGTTVTASSGVISAAAGANPTATAGASAVNGSASTFMRSDGAPALTAATTSTAGIAKLHNVPVSIGWPAGLDPNNTIIAVISQASTISAIVGALETANGATATVTVKKAASGTACSAGTSVSTSFNANGTPATNQTITSGAQTLAIGDRLCLQTTGTWTGGGGSGIGTISVFLAPT